MAAFNTDDLIAKLEAELGQDWIDVIEWLRTHNGVDEIAARIARGDIEGAIAGLVDAAQHFAAGVHGAYNEAAQQAADWLGGEVDSGLISYNAASVNAVRWAQQTAFQLRGQITQDQVSMIRSAIVDGIGRGANPIETARTIRDSIGLTDYQSGIVANYRRALESGDWGDALARELTSGRADRAVAAAQSGRKSLTQEQIDTMVEEYRQNWITSRAQTIARTESLRATHAGTTELYSQAIDSGQVDAGELIRTWHTGPRTSKDSPRPSHAVMDQQTTSLTQPFKSGAGNELMYPGDPSAPEDDTINCRCTVSTTYVS